MPPTAVLASRDAIRDHRVPLAAAGDQDPIHAPAPTATFDAAVSVFDLDTDAIRALGIAKGTWTLGSALPHPYLNVEWTDHDHALPARGWSEGLVNLVDPGTEQLTTTTIP